MLLPTLIFLIWFMCLMFVISPSGFTDLLIFWHTKLTEGSD